MDTVSAVRLRSACADPASLHRRGCCAAPPAVLPAPAIVSFILPAPLNAPHPLAPLEPAPAAFLVVADEQFGRQIPFAFLERVREEWQQKWAEKGPAATAHSLDKSFGPRLKHWMEYCEQHPEELSKVASVQKKVRVWGEAWGWGRRCAAGRLSASPRARDGWAAAGAVAVGGRALWPVGERFQAPRRRGGACCGASRQRLALRRHAAPRPHTRAVLRRAAPLRWMR